jgi:hypothetical protein
MGLFSTETFAAFKSIEERRCSCGAQPRFKHKMMDSRHALIIRVFECDCGERIWTEDKA